MAEHWCKEHQTVWFKKGNMKGYAHPIVDAEGNQRLDEEGKPLWCNEPKPEAKQGESPEKQTSIEAQNAYTGIPALVEAIKKYPAEPLLKTAYNYAMSKLANWASQGQPPLEEKPEEQKPEEPMATEAQIKKIYAVAKEKGYGDNLMISILLRLYKVSARKDLTKKQASELIGFLEVGKYLDRQPEEFKEEIPF